MNRDQSDRLIEPNGSEERMCHATFRFVAPGLREKGVKNLSARFETGDERVARRAGRSCATAIDGTAFRAAASRLRR
jgi:hypothetical protein